MGALARLNRLALLAATSCAIPFFFLLLLTGIVTEQPELVLGSATPFVVAIVGLWQLSRPEPRAIAQIVTGAVMTVVYMYVVDTASRGGAVAAVVSLGMTGVLFLRGHHTPCLAGFALGIAATAFWLDDTSPSTPDRLMAALGSVLLFVFAALMVLWLKREMEAGRARYRDLFERAPVGIWEADFSSVGPWFADRRAEGVTDLAAYLAANPQEARTALGLVEVLDVNRTAVALMEADGKSRLVGQVAHGQLTPGLVAVGTQQLIALWEGRASGRHGTDITTLRGRPLTVAVSWTVPHHHGELDIASVVTTVNDITRLKRTERRLERLIRSKDELVASISHELRTPLTSVVGFARELDTRFADFDGDERRRMITTIADQASEMAYIVEDLLVAARRDVTGVTIHPTAFDLRAEIATVLRDMGSEADLLDVAFDLTAEMPATWGDPARVRQILRNLFLNALRHGGPNVVIRAQTGPCAAVEVRDNGAPIPVGEQESIFDAYHRAHEARGLADSVGLGLTVSRQLARLMNGDVTYGHDGTMSVFTLLLPLARPTEEAATSTLDGPHSNAEAMRRGALPG